MTMKAEHQTHASAPPADSRDRAAPLTRVRHDGSLRWIPERARELSRRNLLQGRTWTLAQVCEHLALALELTIQVESGGPPPRRWRVLSRFERAKRWCVKRIMLATGWFPGGVTAPGLVEPSGSLSLPQALDRLHHAVEQFENKFASPGAGWSYHSILGRMNDRQWRKFHSIHAAHHFSFFVARSS